MTVDTNLPSPDALPIVPSLAWLGIGILVLLFSTIFIGLMRHYASVKSKQSITKNVLVFLVNAFKKPFSLFLMGNAIFIASLGAVKYLPDLSMATQHFLLSTGTYLKKISEFIAFFWLVMNLLNQGQDQLENWLLANNKKVPSILLPMISNSLKAAVLLLMLNILIPALGFSGQINEMLAKGAKVALIGILFWLLVELMNGVENLILSKYTSNNDNPLASRRINTQVLLLKKVLLVIVSIIAFASALMVFDSVKNLGAGLLTTAGVLSALIAFASQQSLGRIFAGLQIAFTQPMRIGDTVIIDTEQGQVEEITLSYIVVKLWDLRRLIVPSDYFTTRGLQNLTRTSTDLLGTVFFYVDYMLPLAPVRDEFNRIMQQSKFWNQSVSNFQVTDIKESSMELRALVSAKDAGTLWDLRCEVREKLMQFIISHYPEYISKTRYESWKKDLLDNPAKAEI